MSTDLKDGMEYLEIIEITIRELTYMTDFIDRNLTENKSLRYNERSAGSLLSEVLRQAVSHAKIC